MNPLPPEKDWYRPPQFSRQGMRGDAHLFFWVAEPVAHEGVYGVSYRIAESLLFSIFDIDGFFRLVQAAGLRELHRRIEQGDKHTEGCPFEDFEWSPVIRRDEAGLLMVEAPLDVRNLYMRPGRIISVNGQSDGETKLESGS